MINVNNDGPTDYTHKYCEVISQCIFIQLNRMIGKKYRIAQNFGGGKFWRIWRNCIDSPKISPPKF